MKRLLITAADSAFGLELMESYCREDLADIEWIYGTYYDCYDLIEDLMTAYPKLREKLFLRQVNMRKVGEIKEFLQELHEKELVTDFVHLPAPKAVPERFQRMDWDEFFQAHLDISFKSAVLILQDLLPKMSKAKKGNVLLMSSYYGTEEGTPNFLAQYVTTKSAMLGLMRALHKEFSPKGIRVNAMAPDLTDTKFLSDMPDLIKEQAAYNNPRGRILTAGEVVAEMRKLLDDEQNGSGKTVIVK